jgi:hypothetical protein
MSNEDRQWGGARIPAPGKRLGPVRRTWRVSKQNAVTLRLLAWQRHGRPTTQAEEDAILNEVLETALKDRVQTP